MASSKTPTIETTFELFTDERFEQLQETDDVLICIYYESPVFNNLYSNVLGILQKLREECDTNVRNLRIFYVSFRTRIELNYFEQKYGVELGDQTLFLAKNKFDNKFRSFDAHSNTVMQRKLLKYFMEIPVLTSNGTKALAKILVDLPRNSAILMFYNDPDSPLHYFHSKWFHQYIGKIVKERQFIPVMVNNKKLLKNYGLDGAESGSLHLIKRHSNKYDLYSSDTEVAGVKCHILKNINPFNSEGELSLAEHLGKISIFSDAIPDKFQVNVTIDRNSITKSTMDTLAKIFKDIKLSNKFPEVTFKLSNGPVKLGNEQFQILAVDFFNRALDEEDPSQDGKERIKKHTYEYLFNGTLTQSSVESFLSQVIQSKWPEHFKSQPYSPKYELDKVTALNFNNKVLLDQNDHLVFEYSDQCRTCEQLMPVIADWSLHNTNSHLKVHRLNSVKNIVQGQEYHQKIPVLLLYRFGSKSDPVQIDLRELSKNPKRETLDRLINDLPNLQKYEQKHNNNHLQEDHHK